MLFEYLNFPFAITCLGSPLLLLIVVIIGYCRTGGESFLGFIPGVILGLFGTFKLSPEVDAFGLEAIIYFFFFCWWVCPAYALTQVALAYLDQPPTKKRAMRWLGFISVMLSFYLISEVYEPYASDKAYQSINAYLDGKISSSEISSAGYDRTQMFARMVDHRIRHRPNDVSEELARDLAKRGYSVLHCKACPRDMIDLALKTPNESFSAIARNPSITMDDFKILAEKGYINGLIYNPSTDESRYEVLRAVIVRAIEGEDAIDKNSIKRLNEYLESLDRERARRLEAKDKP